MSCDIKKDGRLITVTLSGRFVASVANAVRDDILGEMTEGSNVLFDLSGMVHIDSSGLGVLVQVLQKAKAGGGRVVLAALQPAPKIVFDITKVSRVFEIVPTVADAQF